MDDWRDNNLSGILEYPFDFERYMEERLREIDDIKEREFAKVVLVEGLGKIMNVTEAKYQQLERRVYEDFEIEANRYEIAMTIVKRDYYDPTNHTLYPMIEEAVEESKLKKQLSTEKEVWIGTVFMEMNEEKIRQFKQSEYLAGAAKVVGGEKTFPYRIRPASCYRRQIEILYQAFLDNHIAWETIHTGYIDKFFDVYLLTDRENKSDKADPIRKNQEKLLEELFLRDMDIFLGDYQQYARYDMIPLWNVEWITFHNETFMVPCVDNIYYEHTFRPDHQSLVDGYLVQNNQDILEIRHEKDCIIIKSQKENFENWKALRIIQGEIKRSMDYTAPLLSNRKQDSFVRRYAERKGTRLLTKADLLRRIMELDIGDYVEVVDYEITNDSEKYPSVEGMNWLVRDDAFPMDSRRTLVFRFKEKQPGHYLNDSMVRFAVSQIQMEVNEYRLVGEIIQ